MRTYGALYGLDEPKGLWRAEEIPETERRHSPRPASLSFANLRRHIIKIIGSLLAALSCFLLLSHPVHAGDEGSRGASSRAYERASDRSIFNRIGDWFATTGKSEEEKQVILQQRQERRAAARAEKEMRKKEKAAGGEPRELSDDSESGKGHRKKVGVEKEERSLERNREQSNGYGGKLKYKGKKKGDE